MTHLPFILPFQEGEKVPIVLVLLLELFMAIQSFAVDNFFCTAKTIIVSLNTGCPCISIKED